jgi:hypothetical protein
MALRISLLLCTKGEGIVALQLGPRASRIAFREREPRAPVEFSVYLNRLILTLAGCAVLSLPDVEAAETLRLIRGTVTEWNGTSLNIRDLFLHANRCELPPTAERLAVNGTAAQAPALANGLTVEAIVEQQAERCVIRTIYIRPAREPLPVPTRTSFLDNMFPRGNLLYTGIVQSISEGRLELHTRGGKNTEFTVRADTTYSTGGRLVKRDDLTPQTMVQVRAGRSFTGELEVYQITWGAILPRQ